MEAFGTLDISERTIDFLVVRWRQAAKQEGDRITKIFLCIGWKQLDEPPNVTCVSSSSRNSAPSRKGCVVKHQISTGSNK